MWKPLAAVFAAALVLAGLPAASDASDREHLSSVVSACVPEMAGAPKITGKSGAWRIVVQDAAGRIDAEELGADEDALMKRLASDATCILASASNHRIKELVLAAHQRNGTGEHVERLRVRLRPTPALIEAARDNDLGAILVGLQVLRRSGSHGG